MAEEAGVAAAGGLSSLSGSFAFTFLIIGGIMFGVCKDAGELITDPLNASEFIVDESCGGNPKVAEVGKVFLIIGGTFLSLSCCCCLTICACAGGALCCARDN